MNIDSRLTPALRHYLTQLNESIIPRSKARGQMINTINVREALTYTHQHFLTAGVSVAYHIDDLMQTDDYPLPVRIYHPAPDEELGVILFFHGGGGVAGSVSLYDGIHRRLAKYCRKIVIAPEYRLAPECPYPAAVEDAIQASIHAFSVLKRRGLPYLPELILVGDSAGAGLCAAVSSAALDNPRIGLKAQILLYPHLDYTLSHLSIEENAEGYYLRREHLVWYMERIFPDPEQRYAASPLNHPINQDLIPTQIHTVERDPLRDEGLAYLAKLQKHKVEYEHHHRSDVVHGYLSLENLCPDACRETYEQIADFLH